MTGDDRCERPRGRVVDEGDVDEECADPPDEHATVNAVTPAAMIVDRDQRTCGTYLRR